MNETGALPLIQIDNVSRRYVRGVDEVHALEKVSLSIQTGRFVAFMGPSGSGKSTLLNLVSGIDRPSDGEVFVAGACLNDLSEDELAHWRARHVGLIFQFFNLIPVLDARDNVALPLLLTHLDKRERLRRAETALRVVGLSHRLDHYPRTLCLWVPWTSTDLNSNSIYSRSGRKKSERSVHPVLRYGAAAASCSSSGGLIWSPFGAPERGIRRHHHHQPSSITNFMMLTAVHEFPS
jgi:hypothetical protein